jgi:hypothetical protein
MMSSLVQKVAILLAIIAINAHAAPLPGPNGYGVKGSPAFLQGTWKAINDAAFITAIAGQGSVTQVLDANTTLVSTVITTYESYDCINPFTFRVEDHHPASGKFKQPVVRNCL